ncbi:hypothetical protein [Fusobacterium sp.]|uniref:hypothetical protein n=1 Tax=Fusobacterium sp. TaxID=68766 RepID=UPI002900B9E6|nr:hypothetical protein [Fusobacterium sp.]MDU1911078.1 hypothetical protein [Fusobacterium sp.]
MEIKGKLINFIKSGAVLCCKPKRLRLINNDLNVIYGETNANKGIEICFKSENIKEYFLTRDKTLVRCTLAIDTQTDDPFLDKCFSIAEEYFYNPETNKKISVSVRSPLFKKELQYYEIFFNENEEFVLVFVVENVDYKEKYIIP